MAERRKSQSQSLEEGKDGAQKRHRPDPQDDVASLMEKLKSNVSLEETGEMLQLNKQYAGGTEDQRYELCADGMLHGPLEKCPVCGGEVSFADAAYKCEGYLSEYSKCDYSTRTPARSPEHWRIPDATQNTFLVEWAKMAPGKDDRTARDLPPEDLVFSGMHIALAGRLSRPQYLWKDAIEKAGGKVVPAVKPGVTCVVAPDQEPERGGSSKVVEATDLSIPLVRESWLVDCLTNKKMQPLEAYDMAAELPGGHEIPWAKRASHEEAAESLMAEIKLVGKRGIYKDTLLQEGGGKIYERDGIVYNEALTVTDIAANLNHYCVLQVIQKGEESTYFYYKKGRVGDPLSNDERLDEMSGPDECVAEFAKRFEEETGNSYEAWSFARICKKKQGKTLPIDMEDGTDVRAGGLGERQLGVAALHSKLNVRVKEVMKLLLCQVPYRFAMTESGVDSPDLPLGNLSDYHLDRCVLVGKELMVEMMVGDMAELHLDLPKRARLLDLSSKWFTHLHTTRPFVIKDSTMLAEQANVLEIVRDVCVASRVIGNMPGDTLDDPMADRYANMGCAITPLEREGGDYKMVKNFIEKTFEPVKFMDGEFGMILEDVFSLQRESEPTLDALKFMPNKMLLWHGMRTSSIVRCLNKGPLPVEICAPVPGYMFGRGIYFTDAAAQAAKFAFTAIDRPEAVLLLCVVSLGRSIEMHEPEYLHKAPGGGGSVKGVGKKATDQSEWITWDGDVIVPCGKVVSSAMESRLDYTDYVVYDPLQVKMQFLVKVRYEVVA